MSSSIEQIKAFQAANPGVRVWVEEALFRGAPSDGAFGVIKGANFSIGIETPNPIGPPSRQVLGPFPAVDVPAGDTSTMAEVVGLLTVAQQRTIDEHAATIEAHVATIEARDGTIREQARAIEKAAATAAASAAAAEANLARLAETHAIAVDGLQVQAAAALTAHEAVVAEKDTKIGELAGQVQAAEKQINELNAAAQAREKEAERSAAAAQLRITELQDALADARSEF